MMVAAQSIRALSCSPRPSSACGGGPRSLAFAPDPVPETMASPVAMPRCGRTAEAPPTDAFRRSDAPHRKASTSRGIARARGPPVAPAPAAPHRRARRRAGPHAIDFGPRTIYATRTPKVARVDSAALEFAVTARLAHEPLTRAIARRTRNPAMAERAAWAVTREAARNRVSPSLLAAVLLIENRQLDSAAVSSQGAIGMMQVMPIHAGSYGCGSANLTNVDANICHGARILHLYLTRSRSVSVALRRYNGCVRGANTPRCSRYPVRVLQTAARLRRDILASATEADRHVRM